ncbi:hypothetical protein N9195_00840 [bacterium]|nr:hypothetical protein [bacterium]
MKKIIAILIPVACYAGLFLFQEEASSDPSQREAVNTSMPHPEHGQVVSVNESWGFAVIDHKDDFVPKIEGQCQVLRGDSVVAKAQIVALDHGKIIAEVVSASVEHIEPGDLVSFN